MSTLESYRAEFRAASNEELLKRAVPARSSAPALPAEAWLALTEEMERRGMAPPDDTLADLALEEYQAAGRMVALAPDAAWETAEYRKAPAGRRLAAFFVDWFVSIAPFLAPFALLLALGSRSGGAFALAVTLGIACMVWMFYYRLTKDGRPNGQSIGKALTGLMVVDLETNRPCTRGKSALRGIVMLGLNALPLGFVVEPIVAVADDRGRRLGDRAANTQVIAASEYRGRG